MAVSPSLPEPREVPVVASLPPWANWRDALNPNISMGHPNAPPGFAVSESTRYVGRAVAALALDPDRHRWNQKSVSSADLVRKYGFTDVDGSQPDFWKYNEAIEAGLDANPDDYS
jgi:hypothetical protein